jgi:hypothetical protein
MTARQQESHLKSPTYARLERLRLVTGKTWQQIADELKVDRSMLFHVKSGARNLGDKALFRLREAELAAGIKYSARQLIEFGLIPEQTVDALAEHEPAERLEVTRDDIQMGFVEINLLYKLGEVPENHPTKLKITSPPNEKVMSFVDNVRSLLHQPGPLLALCLPEAQASKEFLNRLTPSCYKEVVDAAMTLTFGLKWREELKRGVN